MNQLYALTEAEWVIVHSKRTSIAQYNREYLDDESYDIYIASL
jgi:hypothetical protein